MNELTSALGGKTLRVTSVDEGIFRVRASAAFEPSLFERYGIFSKPKEGAELSPSVKIENGAVVFADKTGKTHEIRLFDVADGETVEYFKSKTNDMRPPRERILGDEGQRSYGSVDFVREPKTATVSDCGGDFYGLGTTNTDRLVLNGKTYLMRVIYTVSEIPVPFVMSPDGWGMLCGTTFWHAVDVCDKKEEEIRWFLPDGDLDFYVFTGEGLAGVLERFTSLVGRPMLLPKWAYGLTFIEQYHADQFQVLRTAERFRDEKLPCDAISLEPGWMSKNYDFSTEKKWKTEKFYICDWMRGEKPYRSSFISALKRFDFNLILWLCCRHDFTANEENRAGNPTDFGIEPWFDHLARFMNDGAAGFKMDPCKVVDNADEARVYANGKGEPEMHNLMQTLYVKQMYQGAAEHTGKRPFHHFCGGYTGAGAYSAATTGDSGGSHKTMVWVLTAGMSGVSNLTCDMDIFSSERIHYAFFTAWCQLNSWAGMCHPWYTGENEKVFAFYDRLRYRLMPYIYSAAISANICGMPVVRAMPLMFPDEELKNSITQFMFGDSMLVAAYTDRVFLPRGCRWYDFWSGEVYEGGKEYMLKIPENRGGGLFVREGSVIPTLPPRDHTTVYEKEITLLCYPLKSGTRSTTLYEDDGDSLEYSAGARSVTKFTVTAHDGKNALAISPREGSYKGMEDEREYKVEWQ